ncbi:hypothetical protein KC878_03705 [Candidatus Saccharibacteria bacterium]|nr:hypothetical protein [Candidatus Saccharibacteria bacterium]
MKTKQHTDIQSALRNKLIRREAELGGQLFGTIPKGHRREFFCLDSHTWIWHEDWIDQYGAMQTTTTRYEMRANGVLKSQNGSGYKTITSSEAKNLRRAIELYKEQVLNFLYEN